jgi:hypothetical protein
MEEVVNNRVSLAVLLSHRRGEEIATANPHMADEFVNYTLEQLAEVYSPDFDVSIKVAVNSVRIALINLLGSDKYREIARTHKRKSKSKKRVNLNISRAKKADYLKGLGIGGRTSQERMTASKSGLLARGIHTYDGVFETEYGFLSEKDYIIQLREEGLLWQKIAERVNSVTGYSRSYETISRMYNQSWKKKS